MVTKSPDLSGDFSLEQVSPSSPQGLSLKHAEDSAAPPAVGSNVVYANVEYGDYFAGRVTGKTPSGDGLCIDGFDGLLHIVASSAMQYLHVLPFKTGDSVEYRHPNGKVFELTVGEITADYTLFQFDRGRKVRLRHELAAKISHRFKVVEWWP